MSKLVFLINTIKYLKVTQVFHRLVRKLKIIDYSAPNIELKSVDNGKWQTFLSGKRRFDPKGYVTFLNHQVQVDFDSVWDIDQQNALWLYNLHYFDDLNSLSGPEFKDFNNNLIEGWVEKYTSFDSVGWHPYPISIRVVNFVKWFLSGNEVSDAVKYSIALQVSVLFQKLEYHLLGNHLLANAKALIFGSILFEGEDSLRWRNKGLEVLNRELSEQINQDGGHFERSPMYHSVILLDVLDLVNLSNVIDFPSGLGRILRDVAEKMLFFLDSVCHQDGKISFFNDSCFEVYPESEELYQYAKLLNLTPVCPVEALAIHKEGGIEFRIMNSTGYFSVASNLYKLIFNCGGVAPSYIPGHAHADTLSIELSVRGYRVFVNSGVSTYENGEVRDYERGSSAQNTLVVNGDNSSEVWGGFRVANRASVIEKEFLLRRGRRGLLAVHDGYRARYGANHRRTVVGETQRIEIMDEFEADADRVVLFRLHPDISVEEKCDRRFLLRVENSEINISVSENARIDVLDSYWAPSFGVRKKTKTLAIFMQSSYVLTEIELIA